MRAEAIVTETATIRRITQAWAHNAVLVAETIADLDPHWRSEAFEVAGGAVVLCGPGLYVNRAMAVGHHAVLTDEEWELLEDRSAAVGVPPQIEITPATRAAVRRAAAARGYVHDAVLHALARSTDLRDVPPPDPRLEVLPANRGLLPMWQETAACGWGYADGPARQASDVFARAVAVVAGEGFTLVRHAGSGRPLGCASLTIRDGVATLGGMSTLPEQRGRGVQSSLIRHRLRVAAASGCDLATSIVRPDSASERNLLRHGFEQLFPIELWVRREPASGSPAA